VQALSGDDMGMDEVERIVRSDEAIAIAVLRLANSAAHGQSGRTFDLRESITRLGGRRLQQLALSLSAGRVLGDGGKGYGLRRGDLWQGSLCGALAAELIAQRTGLEDPSTCFVAGLLRDVGKIAMDALFDVAKLEEAFRAERDEGEDGEPVEQLALERRVFGIDHAELGGELCRIWKLPERLQNTVRHHHEPPGRDDADPLIDIVHCGDVLTCMTGIGAGHDGLAYRLDERAAEVVGLQNTTAESYLPELLERLHKASEQMQIEDRGSTA
jgi:HD-like signal output (HDOD) protein